MQIASRLGLAIAAVTVVSADGAQAASSARQFPADGVAMQTARGIAREHWGGDPCSGRVAITWSHLQATYNATARWSNPTSAYGNPGQNFNCAITLNADMAFDWAKLCTVVAHEYGHLAGRDHSAEAGDLMSEDYTRPLRACATTPEPGAPRKTHVATSVDVVRVARKTKRRDAMYPRHPAFAGARWR